MGDSISGRVCRQLWGGLSSGSGHVKVRGLRTELSSCTDGEWRGRVGGGVARVREELTLDD